jgi:DNA-binding CsgD family transcriptional regulator
MSLTFGYADSSGGVRIFYAFERASGTPLLISHALFNPGASTMMNFEPNVTFNRSLANGASWYMYDCRNSGRSSRVEEPPIFSELVDDLAAVARAIGEPFDVYGRADGCALAVALAARHPERVRRLLLVSPQRVQHDWKRVAEYTQRTLRRFSFDPVGTLASHLAWGHPGVDTALALDAAKKHLEAMPMEVGRSLQRAFAGIDLVEFGPLVEAPSLLISQEAELELAIEAAGCLPHSSVARWNQLGDGSVNGEAWRRAWDEAFPPNDYARPSQQPKDVEPSAGLSPRETEILTLLCQGLSNSEIADSLVITQSTAKRHVANIFAKLGVSSRTKAIALVNERGLLPRAGPHLS